MLIYLSCFLILIKKDPVGSGIELEQGRHPVVELQEDLSFIPNDFDLRYGESNFLIITGPSK